MMPKMDGIEAAKIIRGFGYKEPIVALTANALAGQAEIFLDNGFDGYISKPIDIRQLNSVLNKFVRDKQPEAVIEEARRQKESMTASNQFSSFNRQLIEFFLRDAKKSASVLESFYANSGRRNDDLSMFIINIHGMKSALANIGKDELSEHAAKLEQEGREKNIKYILAELPSFLEKLHDLMDELESDIAAKESSDNEEINPQLLKEKLLAIKASCAILNKKAAKKILAELKEKSLPASAAQMLSDISENLLHSEFDEIIKSIDDFVKQS